MTWETPIKNPLKIKKAASQTLGSRGSLSRNSKKNRVICQTTRRECGMGKHLASLGFKSEEMLQLILIAPKVL